MPEIGQQRELGQLLKTGQITPYGGYQDDGYYRKGLTKSYTILTDGQCAGTTSITLNAKTDVHSNNCVYDNRTKLMWSRNLIGSIGPNNNGQIPWTTNANGEGIFAYVTAANLAKLAGYSDWRIPNDLELLSLRNMQAPKAVPDPTAFPNWSNGDIVWTSTTIPSAITYALRVTFLSGQLTQSTKTTNYVSALVRG